MSAVKRVVWKVRSRKLLDAIQSGAMDASRQREHQREGVLRAGDIGSPPHAENLDARSGAGGGIDVSGHGPAFVNGLQLGRASTLLRSPGGRLASPSAPRRQR